MLEPELEQLHQILFWNSKTHSIVILTEVSEGGFYENLSKIFAWKHVLITL